MTSFESRFYIYANLAVALNCFTLLALSSFQKRTLNNLASQQEALLTNLLKVKENYTNASQGLSEFQNMTNYLANEPKFTTDSQLYNQILESISAFEKSSSQNDYYFYTSGQAIRDTLLYRDDLNCYNKVFVTVPILNMAVDRNYSYERYFDLEDSYNFPYFKSNSCDFSQKVLYKSGLYKTLYSYQGFNIIGFNHHFFLGDDIAINILGVISSDKNFIDGRIEWIYYPSSDTSSLKPPTPPEEIFESMKPIKSKRIKLYRIYRP